MSVAPGTFDAAVALRLINNERLRTAQGWAQYRDLGGALAKTSDAPIADLNCLEGFDADRRRTDYLLDVGFALLRAFDRDPAVQLTPLDRPKTLPQQLKRRGLREVSRSTTMVFGGAAHDVAPPAGIVIKVAEPDDARAFADVHAAGERWVRRMSVSSTLTGMHDGNSTFYLASVEGTPCGSLHLLVDGGTAGIYAVSTLRAFRRRGVATALLRRATADALAQGCDIVGLRTVSGGEAERLYASLGFVASYQTSVWAGG